ncbi:MAG: hypothetical protein JRD89_09395 [Deltaproteobacteria bacterium]|nr:hypothetical protein [Deltaproteobacteria bacterium]
MTLPSERLKQAVEHVFTAKPAPDKPSWSERIALWGLGVIAKGAVKFLDDEEPSARDNVKEVLETIRDNPNTPPHVKGIVERALKPHSWIQIVILIVAAVVMLVQTMQTLFPPALKRMEQSEERVARTYRLDPISVITAWRRDKPAYEKYFDDLRDQGWSDERIEALKFFTQFMPSAQDLVTWQAKEVFEPDMIAKYGLDDEFGELDLTLFEKIGVTEEQARNYWRAHWEHPELRTIIEMLRRTDFTEKDMWDWFRLVEIPPFWRQKLIDISYEVPTRVDVRRWWDMRTIDEARLREIYAWQGYHGKDLDDYVLWTKVYVAFPDLIARWKNGWITLDEVRAELVGYGMPAARVEELLETKFKATAGDRTTAERDITKTDIIKGVKKGVITRGEGMELLMDLGYDESDAEYILAINIPEDEEDVVVKQRELTKTDILNGLKAGVITEDEALAKLLELRYTQLDAEFLLKIYRATITPPAEPREREASKADIVLAVKKGLITPEDGYLMLQDIGFTPEASQFILMVRAEESPFSPMSYQEFKDVTGKWRKAVGMASEALTEKIRQAAAEVVKLTKDLEILKTRVREEEAKLVKEEVLPAEATARRDELRVALHRAEAALAAAQTNYDALVAEWRHKEI